MTWTSKINIKTNEEALQHICNFEKMIGYETELESDVRLAAPEITGSYEFEEYPNYFAVRILQTDRLYIVNAYGRISVFLEKKEHAERIIKQSRMFNETEEFKDLDFIVIDSGLYWCFSHPNCKLYAKKDIGTVFMNKTLRFIDGKWVGHKQFLAQKRIKRDISEYAKRYATPAV